MTDDRAAAYMLSVMVVTFEAIEDPTVAADAAVAAVSIIIQDNPECAPALMAAAAQLLEHIRNG